MSSNDNYPSTNHSIIRFIVVAIVFILTMFIGMYVSESLFNKAKNDEIQRLQENIDEMRIYTSAVGLFISDYSNYLIYSDEDIANRLLVTYDIMMAMVEENPQIFNLTDGMSLYSRIIDQTASAMIEILDERLMQESFTAEDYPVLQLAEIGMQYMYQASNSLSSEFIACVGNAMESQNSKYDKISRIQNTLLLLCIPILLVWFAILYKNLISSIKILNDGTERLSRKEWDMPDLPMTSISEINNSIKATNLMKKTIVEYIDALEEHIKVTELLAEKTIETERQKRLIQETQFNLLQAQINPHFLFNTLNMIVNNVRTGDRPEETADILISTSKLLRSSIEITSPLITLTDEIRLLDNYITIQKARNKNRIVFFMSIIGDIPEVFIPPFTLQPLVENSIVHGLKDTTEDGLVEIQILSDEEGGTFIRIHDNGVGIPQEIAKKAVEGTLSTNGLGNVVRRLKFTYKNDDIVDIRNSSDGSTIIIHLDSANTGVKYAENIDS